MMSFDASEATQRNGMAKACWWRDEDDALPRGRRAPVIALTPIDCRVRHSRHPG